jgi:hypothetical protein
VLCCRNDRPLPDWLADVAIEQACYVFNHGKRGRGKHGGWAKSFEAIEIHRWRFTLVASHLAARRRQGRYYVSELAYLFNYGTPTGRGENIVTRQDIFEFASSWFQGKPAQGSAAQMEESYKAVKRGRLRRKRAKKPMRGGE